jgi:hypothetical protein
MLTYKARMPNAAFMIVLRSGMPPTVFTKDVVSWKIPTQLFR